MLVLTRKPNEQIMVGDSVCITILRTRGQRVRLGIQAPPGVAIMRGELLGRSMPPEGAVVQPAQTAEALGS
jgi:carbon storage regulator